MCGLSMQISPFGPLASVRIVIPQWGRMVQAIYTDYNNLNRKHKNEAPKLTSFPTHIKH